MNRLNHQFFSPLLALICAGFLGACTPINGADTQHSATQTTLVNQVKKTSVPVGFAFHSMAWDGEYLWQYLIDDQGARFLLQNPRTQRGREIKLQTQAIPQHRSMAFGQNHLWLLTQGDKVYQVDQTGKLVKTHILKDLPTAEGLTALAWHEDNLWVLHRTYIDENDQLQAAGLYQIDLKTGKPRREIILDNQDLISSIHQNLFGYQGHVYSVKTNLFEKDQNQVFKISLADGHVSTAPINRLVTGMPTVFWTDNQLMGVELLELSEDCGALCNGHLITLPQPE